MVKETKKQGDVVAVEFLHDGRIAFRFMGVTHGAQELFFNPADASLENQVSARQLGFKNRIVDKAALSRDPETGLAATPDAKRDAIAKALDWYANKDNTAWRIGGDVQRDGFGDNAGLVFLACMRHFGDTDAGATEARIAKLQAKRQYPDRKAAIVALSRNPDIASLVATIRAERVRAQAAANANELLDDMADEPVEGEGA